MKLRLPRALFRALVACFSSLVNLSLASVSLGAGNTLTLPDVEQGNSPFCWAASAADILALETGQDAAAIYRCLTEASGNSSGYVETALSWYQEGAHGKLDVRRFDGSHTVSRKDFATLPELASALKEAFGRARAVSAMLYACGGGQGMGHAITVYGCEYEQGQLFLSYADSADGVQGLLRAEVVETAEGLQLMGTDFAVRALTYLGDDTADAAPQAPVAGIMHSSPYLQVYTDMAENRGVYRFAYMPAFITYRNGEADYLLNVTPDYSSVADAGCYTLLHNGSAQMTVEHNGTMNGNTYTARFVGEYAQKYSVAGINGNATFSFGTNNPYVPTGDDYRIERMTRLVTDTLATDYCTDEELLSNMAGVTVYRVGGGNSGYYDTSGNYQWLAGAWSYGLTAGITSLMEQVFYVPETGLIGIQYHPSDFEQTSAADPLPSVGLQGDSGSPVFIYNAETGRMELVATLANADQTVWQAYYNPRATTAVDEYCTTTIATSTDFNEENADATTLYLSGARVGEDDELLEDGGAASYLRKGSISLNGETIATYNGVALEEFSQGTWKMLDADSLTWYTYTDNDYLNVASATATDASTFGTDDLVYTSNLLFVAEAAEGATTATRRIELTENVDLGIGHVQFSRGEGVDTATFDIAQSSSGYHLSSAGFVVDAGVAVNNYFTYEKGRELRRVGGGVMNMVGTGNSDVLLNIGGGGITFLNRTDGYAAYSALVNSEAVLRLADAGQVYNNVTLGANGGVLDFNGNDYRWTSGGARAEGSDGKAYFGLTVYEGLNRVETSVLANYAEGTSSTITIERGDDFEFAGAFRDGSTYTGSASVEMDSRYTMMPSVLAGYYNQYAASARQDSASTLKVVYDGGATMSMTGVYTLLTGDSGLEVASGTVSLHGTNTIHAIGSESGTNTNRLQNADDWHYAMAEMNVKVDKGATFELGDHALLLGNVTVDSGGSFVMKQAVNKRLEYVEGWVYVEDTYALADYYGLKGDVYLASGANMDIRFDEGVSTRLGYAGSISGSGSLTIAAGEGSVLLSGKNTFSGDKTVESGVVRLAAGAEGDTTTHKWKVGDAASLALDAVASQADVERLVDASSTGVLALTQNVTEQVGHGGLIVGAAAGECVHYGSGESSLAAADGQWTLGGGGGGLYVDFLLEGANTLVLGNAYGTGSVVLTNAGNSFSGGIEMQGGVTLGYTHAGALGNNVLDIAYGSSLSAMEGAAFAADKVGTGSTGVFALSDGAADYDLSRHSSLSLAASGETTLTGTLSVAEGADYRLGGAGALTIATGLSGEHGILIDGQGSTGSRVTLATAATATGAVVVQGYDAAQASAGNMVLTFDTDNALASASSVTLRNNAGIDLNGTNQQFNNLSGDANSLIVDANGGNTLSLSYTQNAILASGVQAAGTAVVKKGSGTLSLSGENLWQSLTINEGTVQVGQAASLGYLASGSQGIAVTVNAGGTLHLTQGLSASNTFNVAGFGADGASYALKADGQLSAATATLNVTANAAISGQFSFKQLNLQGNTLTVGGSGSSFTASGMEDGTLRLTDGASLNLGSYQMGSSLTLELDGATVNVSAASLSGKVIVGENGATINYPWSDSSTSAFNIKGLLSGISADGTLQLVGYNHSINLSGGVDLAGAVEVGNGLTLTISADASIGSLINESNIGDQSNVVVNAATLAITGSGNNFGSNGNPGTLFLTNGGQLQLAGLDSGDSMGSFGSLDMGSDGLLTLSSLAAYSGSNAMMHIGELSGSGKLEFDIAELSTLGAGTYHLLTSGSNVEDYLSLPSGLTGGRRELSLTSTLVDGTYALDLTVGEGEAAQATWKGTGTLIAGAANESNITTDLATDDHTFMAMDSLTITSDADAGDTLTLGSAIHAASVTYAGAGTVTLAQQDGGAFAAGTRVVVDAEGTLELGSTSAINGKVELKNGTLSASGTALNATAGIEVGTEGKATLVLTSDDAVTTSLSVDGTLTVDSQQSENGRTLQGNLSGGGTLVKTNSGKLNLVGNHAAFSGSIDVQAGTLQLGAYNGTLDSFSINASSVNMADGTTLVLKSATVEYGADFTWGDGTVLRVTEGSGDGPSATSIGYTFSGRQILNGTLNVQSQWGKVAHISGDIEGEGALNFTSANNGGGSPAFVLSGNNTYSGGTTVDFANFTLYAAGKNALGTGGITLKNGTLAWTGVGNGWDGDLAASSLTVSGGELNTKGYDVTYRGELSVSGTLTKSGAGTLVLTQDFTSGSTAHVQEGTLELSIGKSSWYTGFSGEEDTTLRLNSTGAYGTWLMGAMSGGMTVELRGDFAYGAENTHTGGTVLLSGSLDIGHASALQSGSLQAHAGTTVTVNVENAIIAGNSAVDYLAFSEGASVAVGTGSDAGHLSFGSLSGTASFLLDVFSADSYDSLSGVLQPDSQLSVNLHANELGSYLLVAGDNTSYDTSGITLSGKDESQYTYAWFNTQEGLELNILNYATGSVNVWTGGTDGSWDTDSASWNGNGSTFNSEVNTLILSAADTSIRVTEAVSTSTLTTEVAEGATLSLSNDGGALSATTLQKDGAGTLSIASGSGNSFGSVVVNEGTLSVSVADGNPLGTTAISGAGTLELTGGSLSARLHDTLTVANIRITDGASLTFTSDTSNWGGTATGKSIEIIGSGSTLSMTTWSNLNASTIVLRDGGTVCSGDNGFGNDGGTIYVDGSGTIKYGYTGGGNVAASISGSGTLKVQDWNAGHWVALNGTIADDASSAAPLSLELSQNYVVLTAENSYSGGTTITGGTVIVNTDTSLGSGSLHMTGGTLTLETTFRDTTYSTDLSVGSLSGTGGTINLGANTLTVNQKVDGTHAGTISGTGSLVKAGEGTLELSGTNSMGSVALHEGRLVAASDSALGGGSVTFSAGASLYVTNGASVKNSFSGEAYTIGAETQQKGSFSGAAAASLLSSGFTKEGEGLVTLENSSGTEASGTILINAGTLAYDAGSSSSLGSVSGNGTFALVGGAVNASSISVGKLEVTDAVLAYSGTFDGKALEVAGQGAELRMGHWASVNNSDLLLRDGGQLSMSSSGFSNSSVTVEGSGILAVGQTASADDNPLLNVNSAVAGHGTLHVTNYGSVAYTVNLNKFIADDAEGALALTSDQSDLHVTVANSYSGGTTINGGKTVAEVAGALGSGSVAINGGELVAKADGSIGSGSVTLNGGTLSLDLGTEAQLFNISHLSGTGGEVAVGSHVLVINQSADGRYDGSFSGSGSLLKRGDATLELGGAASSLALQIDSGTVRLVDSDVFTDGSSTSSVVTLYGGTFDINGQTTGTGADSFLFDVYSGYLAFRGERDMLVTDSSGRADSGLGFDTQYAYTGITHWGTGRAEIEANIISGGSGAAGADIIVAVQSSGDLEISGDIGADQSVAEHHQFGLAKKGSGTMILSGDNGYSGGTDVQAGTLVAASKTALGNGDVAVAEGAKLEVAEGVELSLRGTLKLASVVTVEQQESDRAAMLGSVEMSSSGTTAYIRGLEEGQLATLDNVHIDIAKGATLELKDLLLTGSSRITDDPATVAMENVTIAVSEANTILNTVTTLDSGTLLAAVDGGSSYSLPEEAQVYALYCDALDTVNVTGSSLTLDLSGFAAGFGQSWNSYDYIAISFGASADSLAHFDAGSLSISATANGIACSVYVLPSEMAAASTLYIATAAGVVSIPEPTTATLSLLALSLLAARRRRK